MKHQLALLRPEPGWSATAAAARARGLTVVGHPLFAAQPLECAVPTGAYDALLIGSRNAAVLGAPLLAAFADLPVHAVGAASAAAARRAGLTVAVSGTGGLQDLLDRAIERPCRYLRLAGEAHVALVPRPGQTIETAIVYRMVPRPLAADFAAALTARPPLVALHSAAAASHFAAEVDRLGISRDTLFLIALGPRIARAAGTGWAALHIADMPSDAALLAKSEALCE